MPPVKEFIPLPVDTPGLFQKVFVKLRVVDSPAPETPAELQRRDRARIEVLTRKRGELQLSVDARLDSTDGDTVAVIERLDAEIRQIEREMAIREATLKSDAERQARRQRELPQALDDLRADIEEFAVNELRHCAERAAELEAKAKSITALYGRHVGAHTVDVPAWLSLCQGARSFAAIFDTRRPTAHLTLWRNLAQQFGFTFTH